MGFFDENHKPELSLADFKIGDEFIYREKPENRYRVTDVGSRTLVYIALNQEDPRNYNGPPYSVVENVADEDDLFSIQKVEVVKAPGKDAEGRSYALVKDVIAGFVLSVAHDLNGISKGTRLCVDQKDGKLFLESVHGPIYLEKYIKQSEGNAYYEGFYALRGPAVLLDHHD